MKLGGVTLRFSKMGGFPPHVSNWPKSPCLLGEHMHPDQISVGSSVSKGAKLVKNYIPILKCVLNIFPLCLSGTAIYSNFCKSWSFSWYNWIKLTKKRPDFWICEQKKYPTFLMFSWTKKKIDFLYCTFAIKKVIILQVRKISILTLNYNFLYQNRPC